MTQLLLFRDPRPLVDRLGPEFFRQVPECPGVYLMRDAGETVLYVGKAKNLKKRLGAYRVANPDRMPRRHLRLLRSVTRIDLEQCQDELTALRREAELLLALRPRFNRAGTWPRKRLSIGWRFGPKRLEMRLAEEIGPEWESAGPMGTGLVPLRVALARLFWAAFNPDLGITEMPEGWLAGRHGEVVRVGGHGLTLDAGRLAQEQLAGLFRGRADTFVEWVTQRTEHRKQPFEMALRDMDLEAVVLFASRRSPPVDGTADLS